MPDLRAVVVVDYQNVHLTGHELFAVSRHLPRHESLVDPLHFSNQRTEGEPGERELYRRGPTAGDRAQHGPGAVAPRARGDRDRPEAVIVCW